jgi:hypothetical protein
VGRGGEHSHARMEAGRLGRRWACRSAPGRRRRARAEDELRATEAVARVVGTS